MLEFPNKIYPENFKNFKNLNKDRLLCLLRNEIYNLIISREEENEYYSLDIFENKYNCKEYLKDITDQVIIELKNIGWKTKLSFGDTGLFIYSTEDPPRSCW